MKANRTRFVQFNLSVKHELDARICDADMDDNLVLPTAVDFVRDTHFDRKIREKQVSGEARIMATVGHARRVYLDYVIHLGQSIADAFRFWSVLRSCG